jgi:hypothetical protein
MKGDNFNGPTSGWPKNRVVPVPGHRVEGATHARSDHRAGLARGTIPFVPCRVSVVLFRAVLVPAHRTIYKGAPTSLAPTLDSSWLVVEPAHQSFGSMTRC